MGNNSKLKERPVTSVQSDSNIGLGYDQDWRGGKGGRRQILSAS